MYLRMLVIVLTFAFAYPIAPAQPQDFFSDLFGSLTGRRPPPRGPLFPPFFGDDASLEPARPSRGASQGFCVRTCDGRFFPVQLGENQSRAASCADLCPASETRIYSGNSIERAVNDSGRAYLDMPNAFRFRNELVSGCTCNGKDHLGLAKIDIQNDPTLRRGDYVATIEGLKVVNSAGRRGEVSMSPAKVGKNQITVTSR